MHRHLTRTACAALALCTGGASAWTPASTTMQGRSAALATALPSTPDAANPCWQDSYSGEDDDCLSTVYSAAFVAEEWIRDMPCGKDADCLPENLSHPGTMSDSVSLFPVTRCTQCTVRPCVFSRHIV